LEFAQIAQEGNHVFLNQQVLVIQTSANNKELRTYGV
jgi:hypothetical protein